MNPLGQTKRGIHVLTYHMVEPRFDLGLTWVTPPQFALHLEALERWGIRACSLAEVLGSSADTSRVALTFDDAYLSVHQWAFPLLQERGWTATIFPIAGFVGRDNRWDGNFFGFRFRHVDWQHLRELAEAGWEIGSHGFNHLYLNWLDTPTLRRELTESKQALEDRLGVSVRSLAAPYGRAGRRVVDEAFAAGYEVICFLNRRLQGVHSADGRRWLVYRAAVYRTDSIYALRAKLGLARSGSWMELAKQSIICTANMGGIVVQFLAQKALAIFGRSSIITPGRGG